MKSFSRMLKKILRWGLNGNNVVFCLRSKPLSLRRRAAMFKVLLKPHDIREPLRYNLGQLSDSKPFPRPLHPAVLCMYMVEWKNLVEKKNWTAYFDIDILLYSVLRLSKKKQRQQQINKNKQNIKKQKKREKVLLLKNITYPFHRPYNDERLMI